MDKNRLEALSDGIIAKVITIMVLELKVPHNPTLESYLVAYPAFMSYALSFVFVGLYWSSHHHLFQKASKVNNKIIWVNMLGLFWLSLIPFTTVTMGENSFASITVTIYAVVLVLVTISYLLLVSQMCVLHGAHSEFAKSFKGHFKSYVTIGCNSIAAIISFLGAPRLAFALLVLTALMWFIPNHRFGTSRRLRKRE